MLTTSRGRVVIACLALTWMLGGTAARAVQIRLAPPNLIAFAEVDEGQTATFPLQFFNDSAIAIFNPTPTRIVNAIDFDEGDRNDEAYDTRIVNDQCLGLPGLLPGQGCLFDLEVLTRDLDPKPPLDHADWLVRVSGFFEFIDPITGNLDNDFVGLSGMRVRVHDAPLPEPSHLTLGTMVACMALLLAKRRRWNHRRLESRFLINTVDS